MDLRFLDERRIEYIQMLAEIIHEMSRADGFPNLDACLKKDPKRLDIYTRYASAALGAMRRVQGLPVQSRGDSSEK